MVLQQLNKLRNHLLVEWKHTHLSQRTLCLGGNIGVTTQALLPGENGVRSLTLLSPQQVELDKILGQSSHCDLSRSHGA